MFFRSHEAFFLSVGPVAPLGVTVPMEEIYQHFKARLLDEMVEAASNVSHDGLREFLNSVREG